MNKNDLFPPASFVEGLAQSDDVAVPTRPTGRSKRRPGFDSIVKVLPSIERLALVKGEEEGFDPLLAIRMLNLWSCIIIERALTDADEKIPTARKMDWVLRMPQFLEYLQSNSVSSGVPKFPNTTASIEGEIAKRQRRIKKLNSYLNAKKSEPIGDVVEEIIPPEPTNDLP